ncbi:MAG: exo-alpha-sialidase [Phycisphaerales bacterium]|nr:MAG: exo-alpha-sialidase [Phycisphaerales bacterium]
MSLHRVVSLFVFWTVVLSIGPVLAQHQRADTDDPAPMSPAELSKMHREEAVPPPADLPKTQEHRETAARDPVVYWRFTSYQVNVNISGNDIVGDAANEPSIAIDPTNPDNIVIGWRQFNTINSNFRQAGWAYSHDGGETWRFPGVLQPGVFRSDPVLDSDAEGNFYYYSLGIRYNDYSNDMFISRDSGLSWEGPFYGCGGDKEWMVVDRTESIGCGHIYAQWDRRNTPCPGDFTRSTDGGYSFMEAVNVPGRPFWGTITVDPNGDVFVAGVNSDGNIRVARSTDAKEIGVVPTFDQIADVDLGGVVTVGGAPNPGGLLGQVWIASDHSGGPTHGNLYLLASVNPPGPDPLDVKFSRSVNGGVNWSAPITVNSDFGDNWQWFGTMSVAPNGRIDVIWNDTGFASGSDYSQVFYSSSSDGGVTWSPNHPVTPAFNSLVGWPQQNKLGDYYHMISDDRGANLAYAATFNGSQDVYFLRISIDCNQNGYDDEEDIIEGRSNDCNENEIPDECDISEETSADCSANGIPDECEPDSDDDAVVDSCDNCITTPNTDQADQDFDGKGDVCDPCPLDSPDDYDGDGACNSDEECPLDPDKTSPGQCGCGTPDTDDDGDGVANCIDLCPGADDAVFAPECDGRIPTVSEWGIVVMTMLLLTAGKIYFSRGRNMYAAR